MDIEGAVKLKKYRSTLERKVASGLGKTWNYEQEKYPYIIEKVYTPDFTKGDIIIEVKGFFRGSDPQKYAAIAKELKRQGKRYIFVWSNPHKPVRKGAKMTNAMWCEKHGIEWMTIDNLWRLK